MSQLIRGITALSLTLTIASHADFVRAEGSNEEAGDSKGGSDEAKKSAPLPAQEGNASAKKRDPRATSNDRRGVDRQFRMNEAFTFAVPGGCQYSSTIRGTVKQLRAGNGDEPKFTPTLVVNAWVTCQNNTELRVTDNTLRETAMTRSELEQAIELRASLLNEGLGKRCVYVPDFTFSDSKLASFGVSFLCPANSSTQGATASASNGSNTSSGSSGSSATDAPEHAENRRASDTRRNGEMRGASEGRSGSESRGASENRGAPENRGSGDKKVPSEHGADAPSDPGSFDEGQP